MPDDIGMLLLLSGFGAIIAAVVSERVSLVPRWGFPKVIGVGLAAWAVLFAFAAVLTSAEVPISTMLASIIAFAVLGGALVTDLRERCLDIVPILLAIPAVMVFGILGALPEPGAPAGVIAGTLVATGLAGVLWLGGKLFAKARGAGIDPDTGETVEDLGTGDVYAWALAGAWLGSVGAVYEMRTALMLPLIAFVVAVFLNGIVSAIVLARAKVQGNEDDIHLPLLPSIVVAVAGCTLWAVLV